MEQITAYQCSHCHKKIVRTAQAMKRHEAKCFHNPETKSCVACIFFTEPKNDGTGETPRHCYNGVDISAKLKSGCEHFKGYPF